MGFNGAIGDPFAHEEFPHVPLVRFCFRKSLGADRAQISGDFIGQHFLQAQPEEGWRIAAIGASRYIAPESRCTTGTAVTPGAAVRQAGSAVEICTHIARAIIEPWSLSLALQELALEQLSPDADGAERISCNDERLGFGSSS